MEAPNYAKKKDFAAETMTGILATFNQVSSNRETIEERWHQYYQMWSTTPDDVQDGQNYQGRANLNVPAVRKEIETMSRRLVKGMFQDEYLSAAPSRLENDDLAQTNAMVVRHYYDNVMHLRHAAMPWIKQGVIYGTSPIRQYWKKDVNKQLFMKRHFKVGKDGILYPTRKQVYEEVVLYDAPVVEACDMFQTWVYPETAASPKHVEVVFFRTKLTLEQLKARAKQGIYVLPENIDEMGRTFDEEFEETQERLVSLGSSGTRVAPPGTKYFTVLEAWLRLKLPGQEELIPSVVEILDDCHCIRIQQNPFWHQQPPFEFMRYIVPPPGSFYGRGLPEAVEAMQHQLNDIMNQTMDSVNLSLNPITVINPAFAPNADSFEVEPGAVWWAAPEAVKNFVFPDLSGVGLNNASALKNLIKELSDNSPQLPDPLAGKARSTGQAQLAINEWQTDLFNFIDQIASEALQPMASKTHALLQQNLKDDDVIKVSGRMAGNWINRIVTPEEIIGNYNFRWIGSIAIENEAVRTQQMLTLLKILPSLPPDSGIKVKWQNFIIRLMKDGLGIKNVEEVVETESMKLSTPPNIENRILEMNGIVDVRDADVDEDHIVRHSELLQSKDPVVRARTQAHIDKHNAQIQKKKQQAIMEAMMMEMQMAQMAGQKKGPNNPAGNQGQVSQGINDGDLNRGVRP